MIINILICTFVLVAVLMIAITLVNPVTYDERDCYFWGILVGIITMVIARGIIG